MSEQDHAVPGLDSDGVPQPASAPMTRDEALSVQARTKGQLTAYQHGDSNWYVCATEPVVSAS